MTLQRNFVLLRSLNIAGNGALLWALNAHIVEGVTHRLSHTSKVKKLKLQIEESNGKHFGIFWCDFLRFSPSHAKGDATALPPPGTQSDLEDLKIDGEIRTFWSPASHRGSLVLGTASGESEAPSDTAQNFRTSGTRCANSIDFASPKSGVRGFSMTSKHVKTVCRGRFNDAAKPEDRFDILSILSRQREHVRARDTNIFDESFLVPLRCERSVWKAGPAWLQADVRSSSSGKHLGTPKQRKVW